MSQQQQQQEEQQQQPPPNLNLQNASTGVWFGEVKFGCLEGVGKV